MHSRQGERRHGVVIELCVEPRAERMALRTGLRESRAYVVRVPRIREIGQMTTDAGGWRALKVAANVASHAVQCCVRTEQRKARQLGVIEACGQPRIEASMALLTVRGKAARLVVRRLRTQKSVRVTGNAVSRQAGEYATASTFVASITFQRGVRTEKRKSILMLADGIQRYRPSIYVMALIASRSHLTAMNVGVALGAFAAHIRENQVDVALSARHLAMHSAQWVARRVVVEGWNPANRLPTGGRMAVLTLELKRTVRAARGGVRGRSLWQRRHQQ